jgi:hypothetical protein
MPSTGQLTRILSLRKDEQDRRALLGERGHAPDAVALERLIETEVESHRRR